MSLVEYSDSDSESEHDDHIQTEQVLIKNDTSRKRKAREVEDNVVSRSKLPPIPASIQSLYATSVRSSTIDDPSLHGGRKRQIPHVAGNWPSHIYLEWYPTSDELEEIEQLVASASIRQEKVFNSSLGCRIHSLLRSDLGAQLPLHISLSAPLVLSTESKDDFKTMLEHTIATTDVAPIDVTPQSVDWVSNHDRSRHFLVLKLDQMSNSRLSGLLQVCNQVCKKFDLPTLYEDNADTKTTDFNLPAMLSSRQEGCSESSDKFHISIAWSLENSNVTLRDASEIFNMENLNQRRISFSDVKLKIGNLIHDLRFR